MTLKALVLVHPGSMCGSARSRMGRQAANAAREQVFEEIREHEGPLFVIDGMLSDELSPIENNIIMESLCRNAAANHEAIRIWGCDAGERPHEDWFEVGVSPEDAVFDSQYQAAWFISEKMKGMDIEVTGAWATEDLSTGCASSVIVELREALGANASVEHSGSVMCDPDEEPEYDM